MNSKKFFFNSNLYKYHKIIGMAANPTNNDFEKISELSESTKESTTVGFILCHPMDCSLTPVTDELPPCLFPICNTPALLYVLNWFGMNGIEKIYIICDKKHKNYIKKYTQQCQARMLMDSINILETDDKIYSFGDGLRWIDIWNLHNKVFQHCVVVPGNLISNIPIKNIVNDHIERFNKTNQNDVKPALTACFTQTSEEDSYSLVINESGQILQISPPPKISFDDNPNSLEINQNLFTTQKLVKIKSGLNDSHIYICSSQILHTFTKHYDWRNVCTDCIPSQLNRSPIYATIIPNSYSSTIDTLPSYFNANLAIIRRWLYPVTIEMNIFAQNQTHSMHFDEYIQNNGNDIDEDATMVDTDDSSNDEYKISTVSYQNSAGSSTSYRLQRDLVYLYDNVLPDMKSQIGNNVVIGSNTELQEGCIIKNSVIGSGCIISHDCIIIDSIIWDNVTIEDGVHIRNSLIASDVTISAGVSIDFGCILSFGISCEIDLPPCRRLTTSTEEVEVEYSNEYEPEWLAQYVDDKEPLQFPDDTNAFEFFPLPIHEYPLLKMWYKLDQAHFPIDKSAIQNSDEEDETNENSENEDFKENLTKDGYINNNGRSEEDHSSEEEHHSDSESGSGDFIYLNQEFQSKAAKLLDSLIKANKTQDKIMIEFMLFNIKEDVEHIDSAVSVMLAIKDHWTVDELEKGFKLLGDQLKPFLADTDTQVDFLFWWQSYCAKEQIRNKLFIKALKTLISLKYISQGAIDKWSGEQYDCNAAQNKLFELYSKSDEY